MATRAFVRKQDEQGTDLRIPISEQMQPPKAPRRHLGVQLLGTVFILLLAAAVVVQRWSSARAWPEGLIQVNGRLEGDRTTVSSKFSGRIAKLLAREGDTVKAGQVLVRIDDPQTRARLEQGRANLQAALAQASGARESVALTAETTGAQVLQAEGLVNQAESGVSAAGAEVSRTTASVETARATASSAGADARTAQAGLSLARANRESAVAAVSSARARVETARAGTRAARAAIDAAQATSDKAIRDARRYRALVAEGAVSEQTGDVYEAAERTARAQLESAREQAAAAEAGIVGRESQLNGAREQLAAAEAAIQQAWAQAEAANARSDAAGAVVRQSNAQLRAARQAVHQAKARRQQAIGQLDQARTAPRQVAVSRTNRAQAQARIQQAQGAVAELQSVLQELSIVAPASGTITTRMRDVGEVVSAGTPLLDLVNLDRLYLKVYVPEAQIGKVRLGLPARVYVDAFPNEPFEATIRYIASTAEFTPKEVQTADQRVKLVYAVKLYLTNNPGHRLTPGMPADAVIRWKDDVPWQKPRW
jgi:membrane fusion protein YbhG